MRAVSKFDELSNDTTMEKDEKVLVINVAISGKPPH